MVGVRYSILEIPLSRVHKARRPVSLVLLFRPFLSTNNSSLVDQEPGVCQSDPYPDGLFAPIDLCLLVEVRGAFVDRRCVFCKCCVPAIGIPSLVQRRQI